MGLALVIVAALAPALAAAKATSDDEQAAASSGKGAAEGGARFNVDRLGEVEPNDFRARVIRQGRDGEGHHGLLPAKGSVDRQRQRGRGAQYNTSCGVDSRDQ